MLFRIKCLYMEKFVITLQLNKEDMNREFIIFLVKNY